MPQIIAEAPTFEIHEADTYRIISRNIVQEEHDADRFHKTRYNQLRINCSLLIPDRIDTPSFTLWTELAAGPTSKLNKIRVAMGLAPVEPDEAFDTDEMENIEFRVILDDKKQDGSPGNRVLSYLPKRATKKPTKPPVQDEEEDDEDAPPF